MEINESNMLREHLIKLLDWPDAHVSFDAAVEDIPQPLQGVRPAGLPYSPWELLEHIRITQRDILNFCRDPDYEAPGWPNEYWPKSTSPPTPDDWQQSVTAFHADRQAMHKLTADPALDIYAEIPHGEGQTYLREV